MIEYTGEGGEEVLSLLFYIGWLDKIFLLGDLWTQTGMEFPLSTATMLASWLFLVHPQHRLVLIHPSA